MGEHVELVPNGSVKHHHQNHQKDNNLNRRATLTKQLTNEMVMGTDQDPFNKEELVHTLKGRELCLFVIFYAFAVLMIVLMFELLKPVLFNPNYPDMD